MNKIGSNSFVCRKRETEKIITICRAWNLCGKNGIKKSTVCYDAFQLIQRTNGTQTQWYNTFALVIFLPLIWTDGKTLYGLLRCRHDAQQLHYVPVTSWRLFIIFCDLCNKFSWLDIYEWKKLQIWNTKYANADMWVLLRIDFESPYTKLSFS